MANCYNDCIHSFVCQYVNHDEYPSVQQLKDDCRYCHIGADVVPKSEVEHLEREVRLLTENSITVKYPHCVLGSYYAVLTKSLEDYDKMIADISSEAKAEVAREIFEEIEKIFTDIKIDSYLEKRGFCTTVKNGKNLEQRFTELKKEYTEGESNDN